MSDQLSLFAPVKSGYGTDRGRASRKAYVVQGQERPADLAHLESSAETNQAKVLLWFKAQFGVRGYKAQTPSMCAEGLGAKLTSVRPRITQLVNFGRLERCAWLARRPTEDGGSEGYYRFKEGSAE